MQLLSKPWATGEERELNKVCWFKTEPQLNTSYLIGGAAYVPLPALLCGIGPRNGVGRGERGFEA